jgi:hypothetical protein
MEKAQKFFKKYEWYIIASLASLACILGFIGFRQYFNLHETAASLFDTIYVTLQLYTMGSGYVDPPIPILLNIARFLAPFSLALAAIMTIIWFAREQLKYSKLRRIKNHVIIFSTKLSGSYLARDMLKNGKQVVIIGDKNDVSAEDIQKDKLFFIDGSPDDPELHKRSRLCYAEMAFYSDTNSNLNITSSLIGARLIEETGTGKSIPAYTHVSSLNTIEQLQNLDYFKRSIVDRNKSSELDIQLFNIYERAARIIIRDHSPDIYFSLHKPEDEQAKLFISGLGPLGRSLIIQVAQMCHFGNLKKTEVFVWDPDERSFSSFMNDYPALKEILDIYFVKSFKADQEKILLNESKIKPQMLYICNEQNTISLDVISKLDIYFQSADCKLVICHQQESDFLNNYSGSNIFHFNLKEKTLTLDAITKSGIDKLARSIHNDYLAKEKAKGTYDPSLASNQEWGGLNEPDKNQNRNQADHLRIKLRAISKQNIPLSEPQFDFDQLKEPDILERLAEMEHLRWMALKMLNGFKYGKIKDNNQKLHPNIIAYAELTDEDKQKDRDTIKNIPAFYQSIQHLL